MQLENKLIQLREKGLEESMLNDLISKYDKILNIVEFCRKSSQSPGLLDFSLYVEQWVAKTLIRFDVFLDEVISKLPHIEEMDLLMLQKKMDEVLLSSPDLINLNSYYSSQNIDRLKIISDKNEIEDIKFKASLKLKEIEEDREKFELGYKAILQKEGIKGYEGQFQEFVDENKKFSWRWLWVLYLLIIFLAIFMSYRTFLGDRLLVNLWV
jgi:hypothetical protein